MPNPHRFRKCQLGRVSCNTLWRITMRIRQVIDLTMVVPFDQGRSGWWFTAKPYRKETILGSRLWGIEGSGSPKRYQLVSTGIVTRLVPRKRPAPYEGKGLEVHFRADVALQRIDISDLPWFKRLRKEQRAFSYGLNKTKDRKVIAALELMSRKGAIGEIDGQHGDAVKRLIQIKVMKQMLGQTGTERTDNRSGKVVKLSHRR